MNQELLTELDSGLLIITLNRIERRNALTPGLMKQISAAAIRASSDDDVRAVLLRGAGGYFCVGGDVQRMASSDLEVSRQRLRDDLYERTAVTKQIYGISKPVVAQVEGAAAGAGLGMALACDIQIVADNAKLTTAFAKVGLSGDFATGYYITKAIGPARAAELSFLSPTLSGVEAANLGLVTRSVVDDKVAEIAMDLARRLARGPTTALKLIKRNLRNAVALDFNAYFDAEVDGQVDCIETKDHRAAVSAFLEKRTPTFSGK